MIRINGYKVIDNTQYGASMTSVFDQHESVSKKLSDNARIDCLI